MSVIMAGTHTHTHIRKSKISTAHDLGPYSRSLSKRIRSQGFGTLDALQTPRLLKS